MSPKVWYIIGVIFILLFLFLGGWLWLVIGAVAFFLGYRASKKKPQPPMYPQPLPQQPAYAAYQPPPQPAYQQPYRAPPVRVNYPPPAQMPPPQPVQARPIRPPYPLVCPNCGLPLSGYQPVCPRCGYRLSPVTR